MKKQKSIPSGPWTKFNPNFSVKAKLKKNQSCVESLGEILGVYRGDDDSLPDDGLYEISINIQADNLGKLVKDYGIDSVLAACEKSLNEYVFTKGPKAGQKILGDIAITELFSDNTADPAKNFLSCKAKTNNGKIPRFMALSSGVVQVY